MACDAERLRPGAHDDPGVVMGNTSTAQVLVGRDGQCLRLDLLSALLNKRTSVRRATEVVRTIALVLMAGCGAPPPSNGAMDAGHGAVDTGPHDAGTDAGRPDVFFGDTNAVDTGPCATTPTFAMLSASLFVPRCAASACHNTANPGEHGPAFDQATAYDQVVRSRSMYGSDLYVVIPGDVSHSMLWRKLTNDIPATGFGSPMPQASPWTELAADELEAVRCWIAGGAPP